MAFDIISMGGLLVEIMRKEFGKSLKEAADFSGPFPSGDTPIFIHAAAMLERKCGFIGSCGDDDFGECVFQRLEESGVDMSYVRKVSGKMTGTTFVMYEEDGTRKFLYHLQDSDSSIIDIDDVKAEYFSGAKCVHYTAFNLEISDSIRSAVYKSLQMLDDDVLVSFDPNLRFELYPAEKIREMCEPIMARADIIMPSEFEMSQLFGKDDHECCMEWMEKGKTVVLKLAENGCRIYSKGSVIDVPQFRTVEIDATGAGDVFCAAFIVGLLNGKSLQDAAVYANAAGAFSVTRLGPMEGIVPKNELDDFISKEMKNIF